MSQCRCLPALIFSHCHGTRPSSVVKHYANLSFNYVTRCIICGQSTHRPQRLKFSSPFPIFAIFTKLCADMYALTIVSIFFTEAFILIQAECEIHANKKWGIAHNLIMSLAKIHGPKW